MMLDSGYVAVRVRGHWLTETSGVLALAVHAYHRIGDLSEIEIAVLRSYFDQWLGNKHDFRGPEIAALRRQVGGLKDRPGIAAWLKRARDAGVDPL